MVGKGQTSRTVFLCLLFSKLTVRLFLPQVIGMCWHWPAMGLCLGPAVFVTKAGSISTNAWALGLLQGSTVWPSTAWKPRASGSGCSQPQHWLSVPNLGPLWHSQRVAPFPLPRQVTALPYPVGHCATPHTSSHGSLQKCLEMYLLVMNALPQM